jgi:hypothetical protein
MSRVRINPVRHADDAVFDVDGLVSDFPDRL